MYGTIGKKKKAGFSSFEMDANLAENRKVTLCVFDIVGGFIKQFSGLAKPLKCQCKKIILYAIDHILTENVPIDYEVTLSLPPTFWSQLPIKLYGNLQFCIIAKWLYVVFYVLSLNMLKIIKNFWSHGYH